MGRDKLNVPKNPLSSLGLLEALDPMVIVAVTNAMSLSSLATMSMAAPSACQLRSKISYPYAYPIAAGGGLCRRIMPNSECIAF